MIAMFANDKTAMKEAEKGINSWNQANPRYPITGDTLKRSAHERLMRNTLQQGGVNLPKNLWYLYDELRFTPEELPPIPEEENQ
jgi:hypothetical protein